MWPFIRSAKHAPVAIAIGIAAFLLAVGLGPHTVPYPTHSAYSDAAITHWPNALYMKQHPFALWTPRIMSGLPFAANPLSKVWYPPQWLVLLLPPALHLNMMIWLHLALASAGMWAFARATGLQPVPAALAAAGYALAPKLIAHLGAGHLDLVYAAGWFPWLLWAVHRAFTPARHAVPLLGATAALIFLADLRLAAYAYAAAGAYALWLAFTSERNARKTAAVRFAGAGVLTAALTAVQWVPLAALTPYLSRGTLTADSAAEFAIKPLSLVGMAVGNRAGHHELMVYTGLAVLVLASVALIIRPRALGFWAAVVLMAALYAMGPNAPLWPLLTGVFPPLLWLRVPSRAWFVAALAVPYLAGWGVQSLSFPSDTGRRARLLVAALLAGAVACGVLSVPLLTEATGGTATVTTLAVAVATAAAVGLAMRGWRHASTLLLVVAAAELAWMGLSLVEGRGKDYWLAPYAELAGYLVEADAGRVYTPSNSLPQPAAYRWEIDLFGGVDPFQLAHYVEAAREATNIPYEGYAPTIPPYIREGYEGPIEQMWADMVPDARQMARWDVTHMVAAFPVEGDGWRLDAQIGDVYVYANTREADIHADHPPLPSPQADYIGMAISGVGLILWMLSLWRARQ